ncbi:MAG: quinone oxidoreductase [Rhizobiales bacterium]|nr:quinone oxidoreductase [Hyphomicrobiales bacterium]
MAKAIIIRAPGGPEAMVLEEFDPGQPGPGQTLIRHEAVGVNFIDVYHRTGLYPLPLPFTPGSEGAGEVLAVGPGVTNVKVGDRVAYGTSRGAYASERVIDAGTLVKLPDAISYETAAAMMLKGLTAQYLLRQTFPIKAGDTILVHAAAGGVGLILCQWGRALGATVIGTVGSQDKAKLASEAGAHHVIRYREENVAERVKAITGGKMCDVVYDGVGKDTFIASLDSLRPLGMMVSFGNASGPVDAFNVGVLAQKGSLFLTRPTLFTYASTPEKLAAMSKDLMDAMASGAVKIAVNARYPLADAAQAHRDLEARKTTGASVLIP